MFYLVFKNANSYDDENLNEIIEVRSDDPNRSDSEFNLFFNSLGQPPAFRHMSLDRLSDKKTGNLEINKKNIQNLRKMNENLKILKKKNMMQKVL